MPTKQQIIDDVILELTQGQPSDDLELENEQVAYWIQVHLNQVVANELNQKLAKGEMFPSIYIVKEGCELATETTTYGDDRAYVTLASEVLNVNKGMGIIQVWDEDDEEINKADIQSVSLFKHMRFAKPSVKNPLYSHEGNKIYFPGLAPVDVPFSQVNVWYVPKQDILNEDDDYEVLISDLSLPILIDLAVERGKRQLYGTTADDKNDGADVRPTFYHTAISNPSNNQ